MTTFEEFHESYYSRVFGFAHKLTHNFEDAADLTQEAFVRAFLSFSKRDADRSCDAWIMQIVHNLFLDQCRMKKRRPATISSAELLAVNPTLEPADQSPTPEEELFAKEFSGPMREALGKLSPSERMLILFNVGGASLQAVAKGLGCSVARANSKMHRAQLALKRHLLLIDSKFANNGDYAV